MIQNISRHEIFRQIRGKWWVIEVVCVFIFQFFIRDIDVFASL